MQRSPMDTQSAAAITVPKFMKYIAADFDPSRTPRNEFGWQPCRVDVDPLADDYRAFIDHPEPSGDACAPTDFCTGSESNMAPSQLS